MSDIQSPVSQWHIVAGAACTSEGRTPAQIFAGVATYSHHIQPCKEVTCEFEGETVPILVCPANEEGLLPTQERSAVLAADALAHMYEHSTDWPAPTTLALELGATLTTRQFLIELENELAKQSQVELAQWCRQCSVVNIHDVSSWQALADSEECLWLCAECLINANRVAPLAARVANVLYSEGLVPGEGAALVWLSRKPEHSDSPTLQIYPQMHPRLTREQEPLNRIQPFADLIINSLSAEPMQQSAWYQWLALYEENSALEIEQHYWLARSFGSLGAATAGIGVLCALGRLNLPAPIMTTAWLVNQQLNRQFTFYRIEQGEHHVR